MNAYPHPFELYTNDKAWIARNHAVPSADGRVRIQVDQVEMTTLAGHPAYRTRLSDLPSDAANPYVICPANWVTDGRIDPEPFRLAATDESARWRESTLHVIAG